MIIKIIGKHHHMWVVDASVAVKWIFPEKDYLKSRDFAKNYKDSFHVPDIFYTEVANALWKKCKTNELNIDDANTALASLIKTNISVHPSKPLIKNTMLITNEIKHNSIYDAIYLTLALSINARFATADMEFYKKLPEKWKKHVSIL